jgi:NTE family protein
MGWIEQHQAMNIKVIIGFLLFVFIPGSFFAQDFLTSGVGLTFSGGGAKGLAHIGILQAIDSAGLPVRYVTGTSMGSVIGALYAIGYTGNQIEQIARSTDWKSMLSNQIDLRSVALEEKEEYSRYALEIPFEKGRFQVPTGALESQELWLKLSEHFFPAYKYKNFDDLYRPFRAVATDVETGEAVIIGDGELISAVRASIAIPGVFTAVEKDGRILVDGGAVRNLPVSEVKKLGADYLIASNVAMNLRGREKLNNPFQILSQLASIHESEDRQKQVALAHLYVHQQLDDFHTGSFDKASVIIDSGLVAGHRWFPVFKSLADSLKREGYLQDLPPRPMMPEAVFIISSAAEGLDKSHEKAFLKGLMIENGRWYTPMQLSELIRSTYGSLAYSKIHYRLIPKGGNLAAIVFEVQKTPSTKIKLGAHFHSFSGLGLIANLSTRDLLPNSSSYIKMNIGENPRIRISHMQYPGITRRIASITELQAERFLAQRFYRFEENGNYRLGNFQLDTRLQLMGSRKFTSGLGGRIERISLNPMVNSTLEANAKGRLFTPFAFFKANTLDQSIYPEKGLLLGVELRRVFALSHEINYFLNGSPYLNDTDMLQHDDAFNQGVFQADWYQKLNGRLTFSLSGQGGISLSKKDNILNVFHIGGMQPMLRNQIVFPGLADYTTYSNSVAVVRLGFRQQLSSNLFILMKSSGLVRDFMYKAQTTSSINWMSGHALSLAYRSILGPIEFSVMWSEKVKTASAYVNIGFTF